MRVKVYIVQRIMDDGTEDPEIVAVKLTHLLAHNIAKSFAPARVKSLMADKSNIINGEHPNAAEEAANGHSRYLED